jgi:hypothetical protein
MDATDANTSGCLPAIDRALTVRNVGPDRKTHLDAGGTGTVKSRVAISVELRVVEVGVGVDEHVILLAGVPQSV